MVVKWIIMKVEIRTRAWLDPGGWFGGKMRNHCWGEIALEGKGSFYGRIATTKNSKSHVEPAVFDWLPAGCLIALNGAGFRWSGELKVSLLLRFSNSKTCEHSLYSYGSYILPFQLLFKVVYLVTFVLIFGLRCRTIRAGWTSIIFH